MDKIELGDEEEDEIENIEFASSSRRIGEDEEEVWSHVSYVCMCRYISLYVRMYVCIYVCMYACVYVCIGENEKEVFFTRVYDFAYMYTCMHVCGENEWKVCSLYVWNCVHVCVHGVREYA